MQVWKDAFKTKQKAPYMSHLVEGATIDGLDFANFEDVLGLGHSKGFTSLLIPGLNTHKNRKSLKFHLLTVESTIFGPVSPR